MQDLSEDEIMAQYGGVPIESEDSIMAQYGGIPVEEDDLAQYGVPDEQSYLEKFLRSLQNLPKQMGNDSLNLILGAGDSLVNLPKGVANMISPQNMQIPMSHSSEGLAYDVGNIGGDIAGFIGGGAPLNAARGAAESLPLIGKLASSLGGKEFLPSLARRGVGSALYGAVENPDDRAIGAGVGGGLSVALDALLGGASKLIPSRGLRGNLSPEELMKNLQASGDTQTPLGDVISSPSTKYFYENVLAKIFGSGIDDATANVGKSLTTKGDNILNKYLGDIDPKMVDERIGASLKEAYSTQQNIKNELYNNVNKLADESNIRLELPNFSNKSKKYIDAINDEHFLKYEDASKKLLKRLINYQEPVKTEKKILLPSGEKSFELSYPTLGESNILAGELRNLSKKYKSSPLPQDRNQAKILGDISQVLKSDIKQTIDNSGNTALKNAYQEAEKNYKDNFSSFLDKDIYKFIGGNESPEKLLMNFVKTGSTHDQAGKINKIMKVLPEEGKQLMKYAYLSRAIEGAEDARHVMPHKLRTNWGDTKLGQNQKEALFPDKAERKELDDYAKLVSMNPNALHRMFNPMTGHRNSSILAPFLAMQSGFSAGNAAGGLPLGVLGAVASPVMAGAGARGIASILHSPSYRENLINKMIKNEGKPQKDKILSDALKATLMHGLLGQ